MSSKNWILASLIPVLTLMLSACGSDKKDDSSASQASEFAGVWTDARGFTVYTKYADDHRNLINQGEFCRAVADVPGHFGLIRGNGYGNVVLQSILIDVNGQVSRYAPEIHDDSVKVSSDYKAALVVGSVDTNGQFSRRSDSISSHGYGGLDPRDRRFVMTNLVFSKPADDRLIGRSYNSHYSQEYVRTSDVELKRYVSAIYSCLEIEPKFRKYRSEYRRTSRHNDEVDYSLDEGVEYGPEVYSPHSPVHRGDSGRGEEFFEQTAPAEELAPEEAPRRPRSRMDKRGEANDGTTEPK